MCLIALNYKSKIKVFRYVFIFVDIKMSVKWSRAEIVAFSSDMPCHSV